MADNDRTNTYVRETRITDSSGTSTALIVGGLVVAVGFVLWLVFGNADSFSTAPAGDTTNVTVEPAAPPADAPAIDPVAPVDGTATDTVDPAAPADPVTPADSVEPAPDAAPVPPADSTADPATTPPASE
jgi:hypothetical protein